MKQKKGFLAFLLSAVILWLLSVIPLPFMNIRFEGRTWFTILLVAVVLGIINFVLVAFVRGLFKKSTEGFMFVVTLVVDAAALWLTARIVSNFHIGFFPTAIIAAAILAFACTAAGLVKE
ncbi:MAG: phage holin family protein [Defluviitaleaceae bacterium]|nr:phage holin family protein [Defluviitaleaceae bacterium]